MDIIKISMARYFYSTKPLYYIKCDISHNSIYILMRKKSHTRLS